MKYSVDSHTMIYLPFNGDYIDKTGHTTWTLESGTVSYSPLSNSGGGVNQYK